MSHPPAAPPRAALVIAHPGHELRVHGWLEMARPRVLVLTDGSGRAGPPRLDGTRRVLERAGAEADPALFGRLTDRALYDLVLRRSHRAFVALAEELAGALAGVDTVVGDAAEGEVLAHDLCRLLVDTALALVGRRGGRRPASFEFALEGRPDACPEALRPRALRYRLAPDALARKLRAARSYPGLAAEVDRALGTLGPEPFGCEWLRPAPGPFVRPSPPGGPPAYERHGEQQVAAGVYREVIRYREHVWPLARALARHVEGSRSWAA